MDKKNAIQLINNFYKEIFQEDVSYGNKLNFPVKDDFNAHMLRIPEMNVDEIVNGIVRYFGVGTYIWINPIDTYIDHGEQNSFQSRPSGPYIFTHTGLPEPDMCHQGKSHEDMISEQLTVLVAAEYYLATGFHKFFTGQWMDIKGLTRIGTTWKDRGPMGGSFDKTSGKLCVFNGWYNDRIPGCGPREVFFKK